MWERRFAWSPTKLGTGLFDWVWLTWFERKEIQNGNDSYVDRRAS